MMTHTELDLRERRAIEDMQNAKVPVGRIAAEIGRHRSTVYREIRRNAFTDDELPYLSGYYGVTAQRSAEARRARRRKLVRLGDLRDAVILQLKEGWSPEQIAGRLGFEGCPIHVSHETIYAYVYGPDGQSGNWPAISQAVARNADRDMPEDPEVRFFRRTGPFTNTPNT